MLQWMRWRRGRVQERRPWLEKGDGRVGVRAGGEDGRVTASEAAQDDQASECRQCAW